MYKAISISILLAGTVLSASAQEVATTSKLKVTPKGATQIVFDTEKSLDSYAIPEAPIKWGMDVAWDSESNVRRGFNFIGRGPMQTGRISFQPSDLVDADGNLSAAQKTALQNRLDHIALSGVHSVMLNCDHEALNSENYYGKPAEWHKVIKASVKYAKSKGFTVHTIAPFNEPDYTSWGEGTKAHFKEICRLISEDPELAGIRISAGNTLNCDQALSWYNYMKPYVTEGNTHQLAGEFSNYAKFWQTVRSDGNVATADELHNTMEALVGIHYGMQNGIWWGFEAACRGEFCKASYAGKEIGYGENRTNWAAGAVYKREDGRMDAFMGVSERQAKTTDFELVSTQRALYFDGEGPFYSYAMQIPGGTGYATDDQRNAERMVQITSGADVPIEPVVRGDYVLVCKGSGFCMGFANGAANDGTGLAQGKYNSSTPAKHQQWRVSPVDARSGGDFGYFVLRSVRDTTQVADLLNWSLDNGGTLCGYKGGLGTNEQWFVEYAGDGYWYIRSRHSGLYLEPKTKYASASLQQNEFTGSDMQRWRFQPVNSPLDVTAPAAPAALEAAVYSASVKLSWQPSSSSDVVGYEVLRGITATDQLQVIARIGDLAGKSITTLVDNDVKQGIDYYYQVRAVDKSRNRSALSESVQACVPESQSLVARYAFDRDLTDATDNLLGAAAYNESYSTLNSKEGAAALSLDGTKSFVMLPASVGNLSEMTIGLWYSQTNNSANWARLFDFGNGEQQYMFLTANNGSQMRLAFKNGGDEQTLSTNSPGAGWHHVVVTIGEETVTLYVDGQLRCQTSDIDIRPADFHPVMNYVGRSQFVADPLLKGFVDDLRIYNFALSASDVAKWYEGNDVVGIENLPEERGDAPVYYNLNGQRVEGAAQGNRAEPIRIAKGQKYLIR